MKKAYFFHIHFLVGVLQIPAAGLLPWVVVPPQSVLWLEWELETRGRREAHRCILSFGNASEVGISELALRLHPGCSALTSESGSWKHHLHSVICRMRWITHVEPVPLCFIHVGTSPSHSSLRTPMKVETRSFRVTPCPQSLPQNPC